MNPQTTVPSPETSSIPSTVARPDLMDLPSLARRAQSESQRFYRREEYDQRYAYELFRRALVEGDNAAWRCIFEQYTPLVEHWVRRTGAFTVSGETSDYFVGAAFIRFWRAIPPERFDTFPTLAALLNYLRRCAACVVIDAARSQSFADLLPEEQINWNQQRLGRIDEEATERVGREEFWRLIDGLLTSEAERVVVRCSYLLGMKPGEIYAQWRNLFASVEEIYLLKRQVLSRLRRCPELQRLY
ncbi:MAG: sigma-70 family RNA polymerase sigma factor [Chloroflexaceae bacterium]|nr:sigma-70 family RNA polymerase sigma factor [Chloroflexaceae bacterium]